MANRSLLRWALRGGVIASAILPLMAGLPLAAALLLLLPAGIELSRETGERLTLTLASAALALSCWCLLPGKAAWLTAAWCAACAAMAWRPADQPDRRALLWLGVSLAALLTGLILLNRHYPDGLFEGLAWDCVQWIAGRKDGAKLLLGAYQAGLAGLEGKAAQFPAMNLFGHIVMQEETRLQLMYGLRTTLAEALTALLPHAAVNWLGLNALVCAALPESLRRRQGRAARLPAFEMWQLPQGMGGGILLMLAVSLLPLFTGQTTVLLLGEMCSAALNLVFTVLGLATMTWLMKRRGTQRVTRALLMALCLVLVPMIPMLLGVADQTLDLRRLRHSTDDEGGF